jgi:hypothetical protein
VDEHVRIGHRCGADAGLKVPCLAAGTIAGADSIDDMEVRRVKDLNREARCPTTEPIRAERSRPLTAMSGFDRGLATVDVKDLAGDLGIHSDSPPDVLDGQ